VIFGLDISIDQEAILDTFGVALLNGSIFLDIQNYLKLKNLIKNYLKNLASRGF